MGLRLIFVLDHSAGGALLQLENHALATPSGAPPGQVASHQRLPDTWATRPQCRSRRASRRYAERMDALADIFPIIPHEAAVGVDCCGCMVPREKWDRVELVCNECGTVECNIDGGILRTLVTTGVGHAAGGCSGRIVVDRFRGTQAELRCDKCGQIAGLVNPGIWADLVYLAPADTN